MNLYQFTAADLQSNVNTGAAALLVQLERDGLLTVPAAQVSRTYAVVVYERGWLGKAWDHVTGKGVEPDSTSCL